jgi:hypothetical protein
MKWKLLLLLPGLCASFFFESPGYDVGYSVYGIFQEVQWHGRAAMQPSPSVPDGRTMWLFGDSYINNYNAADNSLPCLFQVRNCFTVQDANDLDEWIHISTT